MASQSQKASKNLSASSQNVAEAENKKASDKSKSEKQAVND